VIGGRCRKRNEAVTKLGSSASQERIGVSECIGDGERFEIAPSELTYSALDQVKADLELLAGLLPGNDKRQARSRAILTFSALVGAMSLARAVSDEDLSREIFNTVADLLKHPA